MGEELCKWWEFPSIIGSFSLQSKGDTKCWQFLSLEENMRRFCLLLYICTFLLSIQVVYAVDFKQVTIDANPPANPYIKIIADLNGDGQPDIVCGGSNGPLVWYQYPDWTKHVIADGGYATVDGEAGDVDNDGDLDIVLGGVVWYENSGNPSEGKWKVHRVAEHRTHDIELADVDRDGDLDIVTRNQSDFGTPTGNRIYVWLQGENGSWEQQVLDCPHGEGIEMADLDQDDDPDIVIGGIWFENTIKNNEPTWQPHRFGEWHRSASVQVGDINQDGRMDIVLTPSELRGEYYKISWFEAPENPAGGEWREHIIEERVEAVYHSLELADFNNDGLPDIVTAEMHQGEDSDEVMVYYNQNQGESWDRQVVSEKGTHLVRTGDIDHDGDIDFIGANHAGEYQPLELWRNEINSQKSVTHSTVVYPGEEWERATPEEMGMDSALLEKAKDYALTGGGSGYITRHGKLVLEWGGSETAVRFEIHHEILRGNRTGSGVERQQNQTRRQRSEVIIPPLGSRRKAIGKPVGWMISPSFILPPRPRDLRSQAGMRNFCLSQELSGTTAMADPTGWRNVSL
jgi:hypothetical protein